MKTLLAIDIGTASTKAALFSLDGERLASHAQAYPVKVPQPGWAEQDPQDWWAAACRCTNQVLSDVGGHDLAAVAVSGQTPSLVALDRRGEVLRPAILWLDRRATPQAEWLKKEIGEDRAIAAGGNLLDSYYGGVKWLWFKQNEPDLFHRTWKILQASSYVLYKLTNQTVLDYSQAGLCSPCFNLGERAWDPQICGLMGIDLERLPKLHPAGQIIGKVNPEAARLTGIPVGIPVAAGAGDFALSCLGAGVLERGQAAAMLGTAGNLLVPDPVRTDPRLINTVHVTGGGLSLGGVMAGGSVGWFKSMLGWEGDDFYPRMEADAAAVTPGADGLVFLPYLAGERTPIWDPAARGVYFGLSHHHQRGHLYRALLEGVAFAFREMLEIVITTGTQIKQVTLTDGGARSPLWREIFADVLGLQVHWQPDGGTLLGTALLAGVASGLLRGFDSVHDWLGQVITHQPDPKKSAIYDRNYQVYQGLYPRLSDLME